MLSSQTKTHLLRDVAEAAEFLKRGLLVAFPTETVFGLGVDATNERAIDRLFSAKGRPVDNPLIVHLSEVDDWPLAAAHLPTLARQILDRYAPGPVTVVVPKAQTICQRVTAGLNTVGIRIPAAAEARELLRACRIPIAAPSANLSGRPSSTSWQSVLEDLDGRIDAILCLEVEHVGLESTVIDCTRAAPILLRPGRIGLAELQVDFPQAYALSSASGSNQETADQSNEQHTASESGVPVEAIDRDVNSPGLRHPHYQPRAQVRLVELNECGHLHGIFAESSMAYAGLLQPPSGFGLSRQFSDIADFAHGFYEFLRTADRAGIELIALQAITIETANRSGIAAALRDRQRRAAGLA